MIKISTIILMMLICFTSRSQMTEQVYLSGTGEDNPVAWEFFCTAGANSGKWTTIPVPSNWELHGFGKYNYGFARDSSRGKEQGMYKFNFNVPQSWKGKVVNIVFEGSMTDTEVKINGRSAGAVHQGSYYRFKYDVSSLLKYDSKNLLEVTVSKHSANESVNDAERRGDFWIFGGIFRPVYLEAMPVEYIDRVALNAEADGNFNANIYPANTKKATHVRAQIYSLAGIKLGNQFTSRITNDTVSIKTKIRSPLKWSPESPNLYRVQIDLLENGKILHTTSERFGFRTVRVVERDGVYVNGVKVKFKGVNRHSFWPPSGRTVSKRISFIDVQMMKDINMNAVRMAHYPGDDHFYDMCDSLGLFVMDELAGWHGYYNTEIGTRLTKAMIAKNGNHPSVIFWANGNEGGHNTDLDVVFDKEDIQHRHVFHPWEAFRGFDTQHYREYNYGISNYDHGPNIVMPTEFLHGLYDGGHGAGLEDYWEAMWKNPRSAGGFLWDFSDQGVVRTDRGGAIDTDGPRGADGIVGPYREKEGSYFAIKEIWSPIYLEPKDLRSSDRQTAPSRQTDTIISINIENRYHYTNTKECSFTWSLEKLTFGRVVTSSPPKKLIKGNILSPDVAPSQKGALTLQLPSNWHFYDVLYVSAIDPHSREIFTWSFPITSPEKEFEKFQPFNEIPPGMLFAEADSVYNISVADVQFKIHKETGMLLQVKNSKGDIPFINGPIIQEGANNFKNFTHRYEGQDLIIESTFDRANSYNVLQWTIYPSGLVKMKVNYFPAEYFTSFVGVNFSLPEKELKGVQYMGDGPYRVWKNRMKGNKFGVWNKTYNNTETGEAPWVYPEFKGYYSNMYWCKLNTTNQSFTVYTPDEKLFFRLFTPSFKVDQWKNYDLVFPNGDISFLQGIPGIGTKTQKRENTGPMGQKNIFYDYEKDPKRWLTMTLYFDFSAGQ